MTPTREEYLRLADYYDGLVTELTNSGLEDAARTCATIATALRSAASIEPGEGWQAMDAIPDDVSEALICGGTYCYDAATVQEWAPFSSVALAYRYGQEDWHGGYGPEYDGIFWHRPKFWRPLPSPPQGTETGS